MDICVNPDQFTLLDLGRLRYADHFKHKSRYSLPWRERAAQIHRNWAQIDRTPAAFLHPLFRRFKAQKRRRERQPAGRRRSKFPLGRKLIQRVRKRKVIPRNLRPFLCSRCGLNSFCLRDDQDPPLQKAEAQGAQQGRTRASGHVGAEERRAECGESERWRCATTAFKRIPTVRCCSHLDLEEGAEAASKSSGGSDWPSRIEREPVNPTQSFLSPASPSTHDASYTAFRCSCGLSFAAGDFDRHLQANRQCAGRNEIKFLVKNFRQLPPDGLGLKIPTTTADWPMQCAACGRVDFRNSAAFLQHVMDCASKIEEPPVLSVFDA
ncbi:hypothetical protein M3Y99_00175200 [Aphelenchoides fujianensis]|nr:hypothetical protein M3Y99_00175200 [Aphelenchoides fujianensis]